jgi:hypothetical protein
VSIEQRIGRRPILAVGNSDGDLEMLEYVHGSRWPHLAILVHHDDPVREYAYDRHSPVGKLDRALEVGRRLGFLEVSMRTDWGRVFPRANPH